MKRYKSIATVVIVIIAISTLLIIQNIQNEKSKIERLISVMNLEKDVLMQNIENESNLDTQLELINNFINHFGIDNVTTYASDLILLKEEILNNKIEIIKNEANKFIDQYEIEVINLNINSNRIKFDNLYNQFNNTFRDNVHYLEEEFERFSDLERKVRLHFSESKERKNRDAINYESESSTITKSTGWQYNDEIGKWISNNNLIFNKNFGDSNLDRIASHIDQNFISIQTKSIILNNSKYYIFITYSWDGYFKYPSLKKDWNVFKRVSCYIFDEDEYSKLKELKYNEVTLQTRKFYTQRVEWLESDLIDYVQSALIKGDTAVNILFKVKIIEENTVRFLLPTSKNIFTNQIDYDFNKTYFETSYKVFSRLIYFE